VNDLLRVISRATGPRGKALSPVSDRGWWRVISEPFTGAWQRNMEEKRETLLSYPTLYACLNRISQDIGKLPFVLKRKDSNGIWVETENPAYSPVLRKPNHFQTAQQFRESWALSKLQDGNALILKQRDERGVVVRLYVLDWCRVMPLVSDSGDVFYQLSLTNPSLLGERYAGKTVAVPAREVIHDRMNTFHHPLIGVPPLCAAYWPAVKNLRILQSSAAFFGNGARPSGILTGPANISDEVAAELTAKWNSGFTGENVGRVAVIGADLKYTPLGEKSTDAQLVEQMRYSDEQICQPFGIPPFKIGIGTIPAGMKVDDLNQLYYADALQGHVEAMENLLDEGLGISRPLGVELDLDPLLRMDEGKRAEVESKLVGGKIKTPDEARRRFDLPPTGGGGTLWGQNQDYPLGMLADRESWDPEMVGNQPRPAPEAAEEDLGEAVDESVNRAFRSLDLDDMDADIARRVKSWPGNFSAIDLVGDLHS
jgi:HK97 family phage portal protein